VFQLAMGVPLSNKGFVSSVPSDEEIIPLKMKFSSFFAVLTPDMKATITAANNNNNDTLRSLITSSAPC